MKKLIALLFCIKSFSLVAQELTTATNDGKFTLSKEGGSYFAKLSLACTKQQYPHSPERIPAGSPRIPNKIWPSFYGCLDWHSGVHNHWALVKLLKTFPGIPEAKEIREKLDSSFDAKNILKEVAYLDTFRTFTYFRNDSLLYTNYTGFEFPYGTSWLLKVGEELINWNDPKAKEWLDHLQPLINFIVKQDMETWPKIKTTNIKLGQHFAASLGLSFTLDYAIASKNDSLRLVVTEAAKRFYSDIKDYPLDKEPLNDDLRIPDFMSSGLLIADLMRKVLTTSEYEKWLHIFSEDIFTVEGVSKIFTIKESNEHSLMTSHPDGFQLNRIWCLNGMLQSLPPTALSTGVKAAWIKAQKEMWDYAQKWIGKGNYNDDHWLSSFSVFAMIGYDK